MKRFRVELRVDKNNYFRVDCTEEDLEYYKALLKYDSLKNGGKCYYREFPVTKNKKIFYTKDNPELSKEEIDIIVKRVALNC